LINATNSVAESLQIHIEPVDSAVNDVVGGNPVKGLQGKTALAAAAYIRTGQHGSYGSQTSSFKMVSNPSQSDSVSFYWGGTRNAHSNDMDGDQSVPVGPTYLWTSAYTNVFQYPMTGFDPHAGSLLTIQKRLTNTNQVEVDGVGMYFLVGDPPAGTGKYRRHR
jgi:hypothetical protein